MIVVFILVLMYAVITPLIVDKLSWTEPNDKSSVSLSAVADSGRTHAVYLMLTFCCSSLSENKHLLKSHFVSSFK